MANFKAGSISSFRISFPDAQVDRLFAQMKRGANVLGKSIPSMQRLAMKAVLQSMATSTKVSQEYRDYKEVGVSRSGLNKVYEVETRYQTPKRKGKAVRASWRGNWRKQLIYARNENELKQRRAVIIAMRGLAAESWVQAGKRGRISLTKVEKLTRRSAHNAYIMKRAAHRWVTWNQSTKLDDPYIMVRNRLPYIESALEGGKNTIDTAMERGARGLEHMVDKMVKRKFRAYIK